MDTKKIITMIDSTQNLSTSSFNYLTNKFESNPEIYRFNGVIGNYKNINNIQSWVGNDNYINHRYFYERLSLVSCPKYEGGINHLFNGKYSKINKKTRTGLFAGLLTIWIITILVFYYFIYKRFNPFYKYNHLKLLKFIGLCILIFFGFIVFFIINFYLGLDIFVIDN